MFHGMMTIYKEAGYTSSDVVARQDIQEHSIRMRRECFLYVWVMGPNSAS